MDGENNEKQTLWTNGMIWWFGGFFPYFWFNTHFELRHFPIISFPVRRFNESTNRWLEPPRIHQAMSSKKCPKGGVQTDGKK